MSGWFRLNSGQCHKLEERSGGNRWWLHYLFALRPGGDETVQYPFDTRIYNSTRAGITGIPNDAWGKARYCLRRDRGFDIKFNGSYPAFEEKLCRENSGEPPLKISALARTRCDVNSTFDLR
ncbi:MAG: hypothetical protein AAGA28_14645 [Pseudomonadota bacterium]